MVAVKKFPLPVAALGPILWLSSNIPSPHPMLLSNSPGNLTVNWYRVRAFTMARIIPLSAKASFDSFSPFLPEEHSFLMAANLRFIFWMSVSMIPSCFSINTFPFPSGCENLWLRKSVIVVTWSFIGGGVTAIVRTIIRLRIAFFKSMSKVLADKCFIFVTMISKFFKSGITFLLIFLL